MPAGPCDCQSVVNTDRHLWPDVSEDPLCDRMHVTSGGAIGINVGGFVIVKTMREWHRLAVRDLDTTLSIQRNQYDP